MNNITIKFLTLVIMIGFILLNIGKTNAYFSNTVNISGNTMTAGTWVTTTDNQLLINVHSNNYQLLIPTFIKKPIVEIQPELTPERVLLISPTPILTPIVTPVVTPEVTLTPVPDITIEPTQTPVPVTTPEPTPEVTPEPEPTLTPTSVPVTLDLNLVGGISVE